MAVHDIIDNRNQKLIDNINCILSSTEKAKFAVGYLFLSGLTCIADKLCDIKELRLLIGNTTNRETLEMLAENYRRLEMVENVAEGQKYTKRAAEKGAVAETAENLCGSMELMDQTDEAQRLVQILIKLIEEKRMKVRVFTKGRLHAKAYIFDYGKVFDERGKSMDRHEKGIAIVGSSNLTLAGVTHNTELNVVVQGNNNHEELTHWFEDLWKESRDFDETLMAELKQSWAAAVVRPYDIYMKTLYALVRDRLEGDDEVDLMWDNEIKKKLADFQLTAYKQAIQMIKNYGGVFVSDVVGLGKSYIGAAVVKHFEQTQHARALIICPASLVEMWDRYNEVYQLNARILSMGYLREVEESQNYLVRDNVLYKDRDFVLIDESHNLRHKDTQRYRVVQDFLSDGKQCCFLTATPRNKSAWDVYHQIKLFHQDDKTGLPIDPPDLKEYFKAVEKGGRKLPDLLAHILIRRTRAHILRWYGLDSETHQPIDPDQFQEYRDGRRRAYVLVAGRHQFFPKRELETIEYSIEDTYQGLYHQIRGYLGKPKKGRLQTLAPGELTYARYGLWHYVRKEKQRKEPYASLHRAGANLCGLIRILLFKRFESSVFAFQETIKQLLLVHDRFMDALVHGFVPAGEEAQPILYDPSAAEEQDLLDALRAVSGRYAVEDFDVELLKSHIEHDIKILKKLQKLVAPITPDEDAKLQTLKAKLREKPLKDGKRLIFTQYADTASYLYENLNPGGRRKDIEVIFSGDKSRFRAVGRFAPKANPEFKPKAGEPELMTLIATDVLAEGLNLQDCDKIINYDLHWNPVRLIQRFGRVDRIGSEHDVVYGFNFLPETGIDKNLGLKQKLHNRIQEIHDTIGEDSQILDKTEQLNEEAMYAIYEKKGVQLNLFDEEEEELIDLNEAEEILRQLRRENPAEFDRIVALRDGIRAAKPSPPQGLFVFCEAMEVERDHAKGYQQLFLLDEKGEVVSRDIPKILGILKCGPELKGEAPREGYNKAVMAVKRRFSEEIKHRTAEFKHTLSLSHGQRYVMRELRILFGLTKDDEMQAQINLLEKAFRGPLTSAVSRELNKVRHDGLTGDALLKRLINIYGHHGMKACLDRRSLQGDQPPVPKIVCSEELI